jgi:hypothetical protein
MGQFKAASPSVAQAPGNGIALVPADAASVDDDARPVALLDGFRSRLFVMHVRCMQKKGMRPVVGCGALRGGLGCRTAPPHAPGRRHCETLCRRWDRCRASRMSINSKVGVDELAKVTTHVQRRLKGVLGLATVAASGLTGCGSGAADTTVGVYIISAEQPRVTAIATLRRGRRISPARPFTLRPFLPPPAAFAGRKVRACRARYCDRQLLAEARRRDLAPGAIVSSGSRRNASGSTRKRLHS